MGRAGAVAVRQIQKFPVIADLQAGGVHLTPGGDDVSHVGGEIGNGGEIQHEFSRRNFTPQGHGNQKGVGGPVPQQDDSQVRQMDAEPAKAQAFLPGNGLPEQIPIEMPQPVGHAVQADILGGGKISGAAGDVVPLFVDVRAQRPGAVFIAIVRPEAEPVDQRRKGHKKRKQRADKGNHRAEKQIAQGVLHQIQRILRHVPQRLPSIPHFGGVARPGLEIPGGLLFEGLIKTAHALPVQLQHRLVTILGQVDGKHGGAEIPQGHGGKGRPQQKAQAQRRVGKGLAGGDFRNHQSRQFDFRPGQKNGQRHDGTHQPEGFRRVFQHCAKAPQGVIPDGAVGTVCLFFQRNRAPFFLLA